jgi:hypothetical protein
VLLLYLFHTGLLNPWGNFPKIIPLASGKVSLEFQHPFSFMAFLCPACLPCSPSSKGSPLWWELPSSYSSSLLTILKRTSTQTNEDQQSIRLFPGTWDKWSFPLTCEEFASPLLIIQFNRTPFIRNLQFSFLPSHCHVPINITWVNLTQHLTKAIEVWVIQADSHFGRRPLLETSCRLSFVKRIAVMIFIYILT